MEASLLAFCTSALDESDWLVSHSGHFTLVAAVLILWYGKWIHLRAGLDASDKQAEPLPGFELRFFGRPSQPTEYNEFLRYLGCEIVISKGSWREKRL